MELQIKPGAKNTFPLAAILIRGTSVSGWLMELQRLQLNLESVRIYAVPGLVPNSVWGCFIIPSGSITKLEIGKNEWCQQVASKFFISEKTILYPQLTLAELDKLFPKTITVMHPEFGLAELADEMDLTTMLVAPVHKSRFITRPVHPVFIPGHVRSFQVKPLKPEEALKKMEEETFPKKEKRPDKPLNVFEKGKLAFYKKLFTKSVKQDAAGNAIQKTGLMARLESLFKPGKKENNWANRMQEDFEDLEKRNQKDVERLMDLLKNNPEEGLKYAIPLDQGGTSRGGEGGSLGFLRRWSDFSLFDSNYRSSGGSGSVTLEDHFHLLSAQYRKTAQELLEGKKHQKAAFVYMKLLKDFPSAAGALAQGNFYQEAAAIYLDPLKNKTKAAECYEKGNMVIEAIKLYTDLNQHEKAGDLYTRIGKKKDAEVFYHKAADEHKMGGRNIKAALIYKNKMNNATLGQDCLLEGWRTNRDSVNCLTMFFSNFEDKKQLKKEIDIIYEKEVSPGNAPLFLDVLSHEFNRQNELAGSIREIAYEIVASQLKDNPSIVGELKSFNPKDKELVKDTLRFSTRNRKKPGNTNR